MIWAVRSVDDGRVARAKQFLEIPPDASVAQPGDPLFVMPWALETLVNEALAHRPAKSGAVRYDLTKWGRFAEVYNCFLQLEDAESVEDIPEGGILASMPRLTWRQFEWQIGFRSADRFYRAWYLYSFPEANEFFEENHGISIERFCFVGFAISTQYLRAPAILSDFDISGIGVSDMELDAFFRLVGVMSNDARRWVRDKRSGMGSIAYKPSVLRDKPCIGIPAGEKTKYFCPLPDLLFRRFTDGLFYDLMQDDNVKRLIAERFESYVLEICNHYLGRQFELMPEVEYGPRSRRRKTPDIRIGSNGTKIRAIIECKSRKIPFKVRASANPIAEHEAVHSDLKKGVVQIWKYASDVRLGIADHGRTLDAAASGVVLMLEPWLQVANEAIAAILDAARCESELDPSITEVDRIPVCFVAMDDWERALRKTNQTGFLDALKEHCADDRAGYMLEDTVTGKAGRKPLEIDPFDYHGSIDHLVPWWGEMREGRLPVSS